MKKIKTLPKKHFTDIKTFDDACECLKIVHSSISFDNDTPDESAYKKLKIIIKAINQGWTPDWNNTDQLKWFPYFKVSSGFAFSNSCYHFTYSCTDVGSRLCFESKEKSDYTSQQFLDLYKQFLY